MTALRIDKSKRNFTDPHKPRYVSEAMLRHKKEHKGIIKVLSYNIRFAQKVDKAIRLFQNNAPLQHADIICLQEMDSLGVEKFAHELHYNYVYYPAVRHPHHGREFGNAILAKWPILHDKKIILPAESEKNLQRIAVRAILDINNKKVLVFNVHLKVFQKVETRKRQMFEILHSIPKSIDHCIIAGDFNTFSKRSRMVIGQALSNERFMVATGNIDWSFNHWYLLNKKSMLDQIFIRGMKPITSGKFAKPKASDHVPIWAELMFEKKNK